MDRAEALHLHSFVLVAVRDVKDQPGFRAKKTEVGEDGGEDTMGGAAVVPISSLILILSPAVATGPPAFLILWKTSSKRVSSSPIYASESEV